MQRAEYIRVTCQKVEHTNIIQNGEKTRQKNRKNNTDKCNRDGMR